MDTIFFKNQIAKFGGVGDSSRLLSTKNSSGCFSDSLLILLAVVFDSQLVVGFDEFSYRQENVQNSMNLPRRRTISPTASKILTSTALMLRK